MNNIKKKILYRETSEAVYNSAILTRISENVIPNYSLKWNASYYFNSHFKEMFIDIMSYFMHWRM